MAATIGLKGGSGTTASIQINGSDRLTIDTQGNVTASGSLVSTTAIGVVSGGTGLTSAGTLGNSLFSDGSAWTSRAPLVNGTAVIASGTSVDFTGIPSWVKRITVMFSQVSTNGSSSYLVQLGTSSGVENTGYTGSGSATANGLAAGVASSTSGFYIFVNTAAAVTQVTMIITNVSGNSWISGHFGSRSDSAVVMTGGGAKTTASTLDRVRITTVNGTDTFDAGTINIMYE